MKRGLRVDPQTRGTNFSLCEDLHASVGTTGAKGILDSDHQCHVFYYQELEAFWNTVSQCLPPHWQDNVTEYGLSKWFKGTHLSCLMILHDLGFVKGSVLEELNGTHELAYLRSGVL